MVQSLEVIWPDAGFAGATRGVIAGTTQFRQALIPPTPSRLWSLPAASVKPISWIENR